MTLFKDQSLPTCTCLSQIFNFRKAPRYGLDNNYKLYSSGMSGIPTFNKNNKI